MAINAFVCSLSEAISTVSQQQMVTPTVQQNYIDQVERFSKLSGLKLEYKTKSGPAGAGPAIFSVPFEEYLKNPSQLQEEIFGPATVIVYCDKKTPTTGSQFVAAAKSLEGQLTSSFHAVGSDLSIAPEVISAMSLRVGRLVWNGYPTGVLVNDAMQHGGPWPSSSDSRTTSVGSRAINRWARPLCYQHFPPNLLPPELKHLKE